MEYRDVRLRIELELPPGGVPVGPAPSAPALPGAPPPDHGAGSPGPAPGVPGGTAPAAPGSTQAPGTARTSPRRAEPGGSDALDAARGVAESALGGLRPGSPAGGLSSAVTTFAAAAVAPLPGAAAAIRAAELTERYGPITSAALAGAAPAGVRSVLETAANAVGEGARKLGSYRAELDSGGQALEEAMDLAGGQARLTGSINPAFLAQQFEVRRSIAARLGELERNRRIYNQMAGGKALGDRAREFFEGAIPALWR